MKKILFVVPSLTQTNGIPAFLINYLSNINLQKYKIDILSSDLRPSQNHMDFFSENSIKVHFLPDLHVNGIIKYLTALRKFFCENNDYDLVYSNVANQSLFIFHEAKKYRNKKLILHSHSTISSDKKIKKVVNDGLIYLIKSNCDFRIACSNLAGSAMFKKSKFEVIHNAIDYRKYSFSILNREKIRNKYCIDKGKVLIGFVGRFAPQKNIYFFINLAEKLDSKYKIMMIGTGSQKEEFIKRLKKGGLEDKFIFIDECSDVNLYYSAMDYFVLPSNFEGLPVVAIEAQANGLPCLLSDAISNECKILDTTIFLNRDNVDSWVSILNKKNFIRKFDITLDDKYDIKIQAKRFENIIDTVCDTGGRVDDY